MKRFLLFVFSILLTFTFAIAQDGINYQGAATDANAENDDDAITVIVATDEPNGPNEHDAKPRNGTK